MRFTYVLLVLLSIPSLVWGQDDKERLGESDPKAEKVLKKVSQQYKSYDNMRVVFTLGISSPQNDVQEEKSGTLYLKGDKYKLEMGKQTVINNNKTIWTYLKNANEVQVNNYDPKKDGSLKPTDIFTIYDKDFLAALNTTKEEDGVTYKIIDLTPYNKDKNYFKIRVKIRTDKHQITKAKVFAKNGNRYTYIVKKLATDLSMPDSFFTFDKSEHPDVNVIDMR